MRFCLLLRGYRGEAATFNKTYCARQPVSTPHIWFYGGKRAAALPFTNFVMLEQPAVRSIAVFIFFWEFHLYGTIRRFKNLFFYVVSLGCCFLSLFLRPISMFFFYFSPSRGERTKAFAKVRHHRTEEFVRDIGTDIQAKEERKR